ncbi:MAG: c-type cytochrome [Gammaproteobacteria bacterium]|nr:c-type cytochrome [Gammaproteobacteria bacterium]
MRSIVFGYQIGAIALLGCIAGTAVADALLTQAQGIFKPLPKDMATAEYPITPARVELGRALFFDPRMSLNGTVSCARCHQPSLYGTDGLPTSIGVMARDNPRNAPTVLNAAQEFIAHWRGDRKNVEDQATKALFGPPSFGEPNAESVIAKLKAFKEYQVMFKKAFPKDKDPITTANWGLAIGAYERTLVTPSPFDAYLKGNTKALSPMAMRGLSKFISTGCASCHSGAGVGGGMYQKFGLTEDYWKATGSKKIDKGRFDVTQDQADMYVFKVPSLRNVAMTPPYFHDGSVATLPQAVRIMAQVQLGKQLDDADVNEIVAFLDSLTGKLPKNFATPPVLPVGAFQTSQK